MTFALLFFKIIPSVDSFIDQSLVFRNFGLKKFIFCFTIYSAQFRFVGPSATAQLRDGSRSDPSSCDSAADHPHHRHRLPPSASHLMMTDRSRIWDLIIRDEFDGGPARPRRQQEARGDTGAGLRTARPTERQPQFHPSKHPRTANACHQHLVIRYKHVVNDTR